MQRIGIITGMLASLFIFSGCGDKQETDLFKAQACINTATAATVNSCLVQIEGDNSERAWVMRCSAAFISQGIDEDAIVAAMENIDGEEAGQDPTTPAMAALAMDAPATSTAALTTCTATNSKSLIAIANMANLATVMKSLLGLADGFTSGDLDTAIDMFNAGTTDSATLGAAVIASQDSICNPDSGLFKDDDICTDINASIAANPNDNDAIGDALLANINNQNN